MNPGSGVEGPGPEGAVGDPELRRATLTSAVQWTAGAQVIQVILQFGVAIVLARLLAPADFGLLAMASAVIAIVSAVQTLGTHGPLIQRTTLTADLVDTVFLLNTGLAILLATAVYLAAPAFAAIYRTQAVEPLIQTIALALVLYAFSGVPGALLRRRLRFAAIALSATLGALLNAAVAVSLAVAGYGVWSLVFALLAASAFEAMFLMIAARYRPRLRFNWRELRSIAGFSANMTGVNVLHLVLRNADSLIIGRWLGPSALGVYGMASRFARQPVDLFLGPVLGRVLFPTYARMQDDDALTARTMRRSAAGAAFVMFPVLAGFAAVARPFVEGVLGPQWSPAVVLIVLMAPIGMAQTLLATTNSVFLARDRTRLFLGLKFGGGLAVVGAYFVGLPFGLAGIVAALLVAELATAAALLALSTRLVGMRLRALLAGVRGPFVLAMSMAALVYGLDRLLASHGWDDLAILALAVPAGALFYAGLALLCRMSALADTLSLLPPAIGGRLGRMVRMAP